MAQETGAMIAKPSRLTYPIVSGMPAASAAGEIRKPAVAGTLIETKRLQLKESRRQFRGR